MAEYIEREAAVKAFNNFDAGRADAPPFTLLTPEEFAEYLYELPVADVAPVVHCRECEYAKNAKWNKKGYRICPASHMEITDDDFCSYGVREEQDKS